MQASSPDPLADWMLEDAKARLQYQHEYTLAGLKTLILINGGAVVGLLTYAGNSSSKSPAYQFENSFAGYAVGLALAVIAYLGAYFSQAQFMQYSTLEAYRLLGREAASKRTGESYAKVGTLAVGLAVAAAVLSLVSFGIGSLYALSAVTRS